MIDCSTNSVGYSSFGFLVAEVHKESPMPKGAHRGFPFNLRQMQGYCLVTKGSCAEMLGFLTEKGIQERSE